MYSIYWMNKHNKDWTEDFLFRTKKEAVNFLTDQGYVLSGGWYKRNEVGWEGNTKAIISKMNFYGE